MCSNRVSMTEVLLTSSCDTIRHSLLHRLMLNDKPLALSSICYFVFYCTFFYERASLHICLEVCEEYRCSIIIRETCPNLIIAPVAPIAFSHVYAAYSLEKEYSSFWDTTGPRYVCFDQKFLGNIHSNISLIIIDGKTCAKVEDIPVEFYRGSRGMSTILMQVFSIFNQLNYWNPMHYDPFNLCDDSKYYRCKNSSKCISKYQICDFILDCPYSDDEQCRLINGTCSSIQSNLLFQCTEAQRCISASLFGNQNCDCRYSSTTACEDEPFTLCDLSNIQTCHEVHQESYIYHYISFMTICDGFQELLPILINETYHSDETECEYWKCNNTYTRCDGFWNCFNGADEIGCNNEHSLIDCSFDHHICISPATFEFMCLPLTKANDGQIDCLGAIDEPKQCRSKYFEQTNAFFYCDSSQNTRCTSIRNLCIFPCINTNESLFCNLSNQLPYENYCSNTSNSSLVKYFCSHNRDTNKQRMIHFSLERITTTNEEVEEEKITQPQSIRAKSSNYNFECHRGYPLRRWLDSNQTLNDLVCFCPSSYYGRYCQYQNQRISLILQFQSDLDSRRTIFSLVIQLIDNSTQRTIHSVKQITYVYFKHCQKKFNFHLTYSTRPKQSNRIYSIHIDIYEKLTMNYRGSSYIPLKFPFLPVHRIVNMLSIPQTSKSLTIDCPKDQQCIHGQCLKYAEDSTSNRIFCHCKSGWTGKDCSIPYDCSCSLKLLCAGIEANNRSICICPLDRWGPRCYLRNTICQSNGTSFCLNNGQCILNDDNLISTEKFFCICPKGFSGERCELEDAKIIISFNENIVLSDTLIVHFVQIERNSRRKNGTTFQSIPLHQNEITIRWSRDFHIVFGELQNKSYYLINVDKNYNRSKVIRKLITSSDRCGHMSVYLNETIVNYPLIRRIKYYHLPCQNRISCFYDRDHICLCNDFGSERVANCFEFDSTLTHNCFKLSNCQHDSQCIQDDIHCPQTSRCICRECYYGSLCQFQSSLFDLSLDAIIGSHIQPNLSFNNQPLFVKITLLLIVVLVTIGIINGILSYVAFQSQETRRVGCGYYLLGSTITTLLTSVMLLLKFSILLLAQMSIIKNRTFLNIQCYSFDYLLQICLNMDRWLNGCIAIERSINIIKGARFNKEKSKQIAKYVICFLIIGTLNSAIYDPIHRRLVDDNSNDDQYRIWCIVSYPYWFQYLNRTIHMFHFFIPFLMNFISSLIIIILSTKRRLILQSDQPYCQLLYEQTRQHRHLLAAPFVLIILSLPRLILSFLGGCIKSNHHPWSYIIGYLISFIPPMLTFIIFVLPSKLYKKEFRKTIDEYLEVMRTRKCFILC